MAYSKELQVNANEKILNFMEYDEFMTTLYASLERFMMAAPSDGIVNVEVSKLGSGYTVGVQLVSSALKFVEQASAQSPFVALEKVLLKAKDAVHTWAITRKV